MLALNKQLKRERRDETRAGTLQVPKTRAQKQLQEEQAGGGADAKVSHQDARAGLEKVVDVAPFVATINASENSTCTVVLVEVKSDIFEGGG